MSFSEKAKHSVLQPLHKLLKAKCLMWIQSKHMEQNVFVNWIIHLKKMKILSYLPSCCFKPIWLTLFCGTQKENFWRISWWVFSISKWELGLSSFKMAKKHHKHHIFNELVDSVHKIGLNNHRWIRLIWFSLYIYIQLFFVLYFM